MAKVRFAQGPKLYKNRAAWHHATKACESSSWRGYLLSPDFETMTVRKGKVVPGCKSDSVMMTGRESRGSGARLMKAEEGNLVGRGQSERESTRKSEREVRGDVSVEWLC